MGLMGLGARGAGAAAAAVDIDDSDVVAAADRAAGVAAGGAGDVRSHHSRPCLPPRV